MDYKKHYDKLIEKAKNRILEGYVENHHIIPRAFGGLDTLDNLAKLTAREHFVAHLLLYKIQTNKRKRFQMLTACIMMKGKISKNSRLYESARKEFSKMHSENIRGENHPMFGVSRFGEDNPFFGKTHSEDVKKKMSEKAKGLVMAKKISTGEIIKVTKEEFETNDDLVGSTSGYKVSPETRKKISTTSKGKPQEQVQCPCCSKIGGISNMTRWHFDNCKYKEIIANTI
jgi:hypothetical protein